MENFVEQLVAEYYKSKGYIVMSNYWIPYITIRERKQKGKSQKYNAQSWTDIDILARNDDELLIIQVKSIINQKIVTDKIIDFFKIVDDFLNIGLALDNHSDIKWWFKEVVVKKIVVYEHYSPPSYVNLLIEKGVSVKKFTDLFKEIIEYASNRKGIKEQNASMRFLHFLLNESLLSKNTAIELFFDGKKS